MAKMSKKRCSMCGTKIDPIQLVAHGKDNFCSQSCYEWFIQTYESEEEVKPSAKRVGNSK